MNEKQINIIKELAKPIVEQEDMFLLDVEIKNPGKTELWVYVDSEEDDISVTSCSKISRELEFVLDAYDLINSHYTLNVSSPGLSRPLTDHRQYRKNMGRRAKIKFKDEDGYQKLEGILRNISQMDIVLETENNDSQTILLDSIVETRIIPDL